MVRTILAAVLALVSVILLLPVILVAGAFYLFASGVRAIGRLLEPHFVPWAELMTFDASLGWRPRPNLDARYLADRDDVFRAVTDAEGWPGTRTLAESDVVVIGDSFAFGYGVDPGSSFAQVTRGVKIKAVGAPGYSMVQGVLLMEQFAQRLSGKLVVWFVCLENDLQDNLTPSMHRYRSPFVRPSRTSGGWETVGDHLTTAPWICSDLSKRILAHLCVPGPLADRAYSACDYLIARASALCTSVGASLVVVTIPDPSQLTDTGRQGLAIISGKSETWDQDLPDRRFSEICGRFAVPHIVGKQHFSAGDYKPIEALHWNERGHRRMAEVLERLYQSFRSGALEGVPSSRPHAGDRIATLHESPAALRSN